MLSLNLNPSRFSSLTLQSLSQLHVITPPPRHPFAFPRPFAIKSKAQRKEAKSVEFSDRSLLKSSLQCCFTREAVGTASAVNRPSFHTGSHPRGLRAAHRLLLIVSCCTEVASLGHVACSEQGPGEKPPPPLPLTLCTLRCACVYLECLMKCTCKCVKQHRANA